MQELTKLQPLFTELRPLLPSSERFQLQLYPLGIASNLAKQKYGE